MAYLSLVHTFYYLNYSTQPLLNKNKNNNKFGNFQTLVTRSGQLPTDPPASETFATRKENPSKNLKKFLGVINRVENFGKRMKETMSPKQKGDWKDLVLMSLSFVIEFSCKTCDQWPAEEIETLVESFCKRIFRRPGDTVIRIKLDRGMWQEVGNEINTTHVGDDYNLHKT